MPREKFLPFHVPEIGQEEIDGVVDTLRSGWLTTGPKVRAFEAAFSQYLGGIPTAAVNSGTAALHLAMDAIGLAPGDEVLLPTMTFTATAEVVTYYQARPVLIDCEPDTLNIDPAKLERAITPRTRAILPVHFGGHSCEMDSIVEIAKQHRLLLVEDAAHALPCAYRGIAAGTFGDLGCFSFYATKTITTGEGGMVVSRNPEYIEHVRMMSYHGLSKNAWKRFAAQAAWYYEVEAPGYKYNMTDIAAALGLAQLPKCAQFQAARRAIAELYSRELGQWPEVELPALRPENEHSWHLYIIRLNLERLTIDRAEFVEQLRQRNIGANVQYMPLHLHPFYRRTFGYRPEQFPVAGAAYPRMISLPLYPRMSERDALDVVEAIQEVIRAHRR